MVCNTIFGSAKLQNWFEVTVLCMSWCPSSTRSLIHWRGWRIQASIGLVSKSIQIQWFVLCRVESALEWLERFYCRTKLTATCGKLSHSKSWLRESVEDARIFMANSLVVVFIVTLRMWEFLDWGWIVTSGLHCIWPPEEAVLMTLVSYLSASFSLLVVSVAWLCANFDETKMRYSLAMSRIPLCVTCLTVKHL